MRHAPLPPHFLIDHFRQVESIRAPKYTGAGIPPTDKVYTKYLLLQHCNGDKSKQNKSKTKGYMQRHNEAHPES